jgi:putative restriction endonuclease
MAHVVFIQNPDSIYDDLPGRRYNFPSAYLNMVQEAVGDWVVFYESKKGAFGYVGVQRVVDVVADPKRDDWYFAELDPGTLLQFETLVPRTDGQGRTYERRLMGADGRPYSGGLNTSAVRRITPAEFAAIVEAGLTEAHGPDALPRSPVPGFAEAQSPFGEAPLASDRVRQLSDRAYRDAAFARMVKAAYGGICAISGLSLRNGGGRAEVQAAHIRPVCDKGPDIVPNGLALSGTLHWMFDRGLISVAEDHSILVSHNKVDLATVDRLIHPSRKLILPKARRDHPHPDYLRYHREEVFGRAA